MSQEKNKNFNVSTNLYELSKTLRFELKPTEETQKMLEKNQIFEKDQRIQKKYEQTKPFFDRLHREFVAESLKDLKFSNLEKYEKALKNVKKITRETEKKKADIWRKELDNQEKRLRKEVVAQFDNTAKIWTSGKNAKYSGLKNKDIKFLEEEAVFEKVLLKRYRKEEKSFLRDEKDTKFLKNKNGEKISIFENWKGFTGYFGKFFETRKNFYKNDGTSTAIATRIVDQNLRRFVENTETIKKYPQDFLLKLDAKDLEEIKSIEKYTQFVLQGDKEKTEGINFYNVIVGKIKYEINQYRQKTKQKLSYLKTLDKQILSEKEKFIEEIVSSENETNLRKVLEELLKTGKEKTELLKKLFSNFVKHQEKYNLERVYFSKKGLETISRKWTLERERWEDNLAKVYKEEEKKILSKKKDAGYSFPDFIPLAYLKKALEKNFKNIKNEEEKANRKIFWKEKYKKEDSTEENIWTQFLEIFHQEFSELFKKTIQTNQSEKIVGYTKFYQELENVLQVEKLEKIPKLTVAVKNFADSFLSFYQFSKYFAVEKSKNWDDSVEIDDMFYSCFKEEFYDDTFKTIIQPYNLLRNYLTKKPWEDVQKWKLNFENPTLADGWDKNKESDNSAVILRKNEKYYLGIMRKGANDIFDEKYELEFSQHTEQGKYKKMVYKLLPGANKMLPKVFFSKSNIDFYNPSDEILKIRNCSSHTKSGAPQKGFQKKEFNLRNCHKMIEFFMYSLKKHKRWKDFNFNFSGISKYEDISGFYRDIEKGGYKISWDNISEKYIEEKNKNGELYLFQIKNKDWNLKDAKPKIGAKNLHTMYFESLFSKENEAENFVMKLNGRAEIFFRPKTSAEKLGYRKNNDDSIKTFIDKDGQKQKVIRNKRYAEDKIFFHLPMTINRGKDKPYPGKFNQEINNKLLANNPNINIIGIDRGEKHLAYYSVINQKGEILESDSLNIINSVDYYKKLEEKAGDRKQAREDWQNVEGIKDLKKGYISQVVKKIADLAIEHNAIIVFEDLNMRFKQIRGGIEKSVYQQLEKALIDKFNFLVDKGEKDLKKAGHFLKAYQLAAPVEAFKDMGKQTGIIFYTTANYTSKIDPVSGWRPNVYFKKGNAKVNKNNILKFDSIIFSKAKERFEITYDLIKVIKSDKAKYPQKTKWTVCSNVQRFKGSRKEKNNNQWGYDEYPTTGKDSITERLKELFKKYDIEISGNILEQIKKMETKDNEKFFSDLLFFFQLICQIRNTDPKATGHNADFILSPVEKNGEFFDTRNPSNASKNLPKNGDDNGAYNIARKGIITLQRINEWANLSDKEKEKIKYPDLFITNAEWDAFATKSKKFVSSII